MQRKFKFENEKRHYEVPTLESTFVNVEAGFAISTEKTGNTTGFGKTEDNDMGWDLD